LQIPGNVTSRLIVGTHPATTWFWCTAKERASTRSSLDASPSCAGSKFRDIFWSPLKYDKSIQPSLTTEYLFSGSHFGDWGKMGKPTSTEAAPARPPPSLKKQSSSTSQAAGQRSIHSFFTKSSPVSGISSPTPAGTLNANGTGNAANAIPRAKSVASGMKPAFRKPSMRNATPGASSDAAAPSSSQDNDNGGIPDEDLLSLVSPARNTMREETYQKKAVLLGSSPSRKVCFRERPAYNCC
jgi:hypothetical protein